MKIISLFFFYTILIFSINAQQNHFDIKAGFGSYSTPHKKVVRNNFNVQFEMEYHFKNKFSLAMGTIYGEYIYYQEGSRRSTLSGIPINNGDELQNNLLLKYKIIDKKFNLQVGTGFGLINTGNLEEVQSGSGSTYLHPSILDIGFPISIETYYPLSEKIFLGAKFGSFILPDYPIVGNNLGFQIKYRFK